MSIDLKKRQRRFKIHAVIKALRQGYRLFHAVRAGKVSRETWRRWENKWPKLEALRRAAEESKDENEVREVETAFVTKLKNGKGHPIEYIFYFTNRDPVRWKDRRTIPLAKSLAASEGNSADTSDRELEEDKILQRDLLGQLAEIFPK